MKLRLLTVFILICLVIGMHTIVFAKEYINASAQLSPKILIAYMNVPENIMEKYSDQTISLTVLVPITIEGRVDKDVQILDGSGDSALDDAVMESVRKFRFTPARQEYISIPSKIKLPISFVKGKYVIEQGEMINESPNNG